MNLQEFKFPLDDACFNTIPELLQEAKIRGFTDYNNKFVKFFRILFYNGGNIIRKENYNNDMGIYLVNFMRSFAPDHNDKSAICAMLLSELVDDVKDIQKTEKEIDEIFD